MHFGNPVWFHGLWLLPPLILFCSWALKKKQGLLHKFCSAEILPRLTSSKIWFHERRKMTFLVLGLTCLLLALTRPQWGFQWEDLHQEGVDIIIALDVSRSMLAEDIKPNRLTRAKFKVADLLGMLSGDRVGLVAFAGTSYVQCPLTLDYSAASIFLDAIDTDLIPVPGTAIAHALYTSIQAFNESERKSKAIILITDGEDHGGEMQEASDMAKKEGIKVYTIGIGQEMGSPIPLGPNKGFKKDGQGQVVLSKLDETSLQKMALETGGVYVRSVTGDMDLKRIYLEDIKQTIEKKQLKSTRQKLWHEQFQWFIFAALFFLSLEFIRKED